VNLIVVECLANPGRNNFSNLSGAKLILLASQRKKMNRITASFYAMLQVVRVHFIALV
jgi:ribosomal protein L30E